MLKVFLGIILVISSFQLSAQLKFISGYTYESQNRGYLGNVVLKLVDEKEIEISKVYSDQEGYFEFDSIELRPSRILISKPLYKDSIVHLTNEDILNEKLFLKIRLERAEGYLLELTINHENNTDLDGNTNCYRIDIYNNTKDKEESVFECYNSPFLSIPLIKDNHYTVLIRKEGYVSKRIEAYVNVKDCILCFEGLGLVSPGASESLSKGNVKGVVLSNIFLEEAYQGKKIQIQNLYYELSDWKLDKKSKSELKKLGKLMRDNPRWIVEIGSHTDSRGTDRSNLILSDKRAEEVVSFLLNEENIDRTRIAAKGYGEEKLINRCSNGVACSDSEHLENRRTELEIIGMSYIQRFASLKEIKKAENNNELLEQIKFGEQLMIPVMTEELDSLLLAKQDSIKQSIPMENNIELLEAGINYKIVIHESSSKLAANHIIRQTHSNLTEYNYDGTYLYLIGSFNSQKEAEEFYKNIALLAYPESYIFKMPNSENKN